MESKPPAKDGLNSSHVERPPGSKKRKRSNNPERSQQSAQMSEPLTERELELHKRLEKLQLNETQRNIAAKKTQEIYNDKVSELSAELSATKAQLALALEPKPEVLPRRTFTLAGNPQEIYITLNNDLQWYMAGFGELLEEVEEYRRDWDKRGLPATKKPIKRAVAITAAHVKYCNLSMAETIAHIERTAASVAPLTNSEHGDIGKNKKSFGNLYINHEDASDTFAAEPAATPVAPPGRSTDRAVSSSRRKANRQSSGSNSNSNSRPVISDFQQVKEGLDRLTCLTMEQLDQFANALTLKSQMVSGPGYHVVRPFIRRNPCHSDPVFDTYTRESSEA